MGKVRWTYPMRLAAPMAALLIGASVSASPVGEARKLVRKLVTVKSPAELPPLLTNETAAGMGVVFGAMLGMTGAMADAMTGAVEGMADALGDAMGSQPQDPMGDAIGDGIVGEHPKKPRPPKKATGTSPFSSVMSDVERVFRKHGVPTDNSTRSLTPAQRARIARSGRALLTDVIRIMEKLPESKGGGSKGIMPNKDIRPEKLKYRQISATRVQIIDPSSPKARLEARVENGAWRLHMQDAVAVLDGKPGPSPR